MTTNIQQGTLLDVLKKKMRQTKEEMEKYKDECEEYQKRLQLEVLRREDVSSNTCFNVAMCTIRTPFFYCKIFLNMHVDYNMYFWNL